MASEQEDVARHRLDGPVFVHRANDGLLWFEDHAVVGDLGDGATGGRGSDTGSAPRPQYAVDAVAVQVRAPPAAAGDDALARQLDDLVEIRPRQRRVGRSSSDHLVQLVLAASTAVMLIRSGLAALIPAARPGVVLGLPAVVLPAVVLPVPVLAAWSSRRGDLGDELLGEDVERRDRWVDAVERARVDRGEKRGALDQLIASERVEPPLGDSGDAVLGTADPLQEGCDTSGRAELAHEIDWSDVDAEFERGGRNEGAQLAGTQPCLDA